jgi:hypothetical protein
VPTRKKWESGGRNVACVLYHDQGDQLTRSFVAVE